jgi:hypothetical protein
MTSLAEVTKEPADALRSKALSADEQLSAFWSPPFPDEVF